ncbi:MAG: prepilin-type N-terminal cleavage/methylation domain-containing protein [Spartobacteria bacterium]|nr:prepilin-type N-terminal cleavage/methylation domain-containing protein [Spartobacteria bacterium]
MKNSAPIKGFTLIEIVVVLMMVGMVAGLGSMLVVHMVNGYTRSRSNAQLAQHVELAMGRLVREARYVDRATNHAARISSSGSSVVFRRGGANRTVSLSGSTLNMTVNGTAYPLMKDVSSFAFSPNPIPANPDLISFVITPAGSGVPVYSNRVYVGE